MKMKAMLNRVMTLVAALVFAASVAAAAPADQMSERAAFEQLAKKVRKEVVTPSTRKDAERRVRKLKGVERVVNNIEVLPLSGFDDSIRANTYRALFGWNSPPFGYGRGGGGSAHART